MQEQRMVAPDQPKKPGVVAERGGSDAAHDLDGLLLEVSRAAARHRDLQSLLCELVTLLRRAVTFDRLGVNNALVSSLEHRALFSAIVSCLRRVVAHDYTSVAVHDPERGTCDLRALEFAGKGLIKEGTSKPLDASPAMAAFAAGKPMRF